MKTPLKVTCRSAEHSWTTEGFLPFEIYGEKFAVTENLGFWRATHIKTGAAVPCTDCSRKTSVKKAALAVLEKAGEAAFKKAIKSIKALSKPYVKSP